MIICLNIWPIFNLNILITIAKKISKEHPFIYQQGIRITVEYICKNHQMQHFDESFYNFVVFLQAANQYLQLFVKMMKTQAGSACRSTSNSAEASRLKKSNSSGINKLKSSISSQTTTVPYSIKQTRVNTSSKSNKKNNLQASQSNKSLKTFNDNHSQSHLDSSKKNNPNPCRPEPTPPVLVAKKTAVPIKNLKQKAIGQAINSSKVYRNQEEKQNEVQCPKKHLHNSPLDKKLFLKESNARISNRETTNQSLFNFSCLLPPQNTEEVSLAQFEVGRKLGKGRFGDVYMARDLRTGFVLAIKMINKKEVKEAGMDGQVAQEIKVQLFTNHPNVLKLYGFFSDHAKIYLLLQLATHGCLFKQIRTKNYCEESLASFYFRQVSGAVRYLHSLYVIHRDIKPENILNCFSVLKVCDFGWATYSPLYQRQTFCGTLDYVAPEIVTGDFYDERADVWCLGVLCYELCTGKAPFQSKAGENETYDKILKVDIEFPIYLSGQVVDFIAKILCRDPTKRMGLDQVDNHEWMRRYENEAGRMIPKEIWEAWTRLSRTD